MILDELFFYENGDHPSDGFWPPTYTTRNDKFYFPRKSLGLDFVPLPLVYFPPFLLQLPASPGSLVPWLTS